MPRLIEVDLNNVAGGSAREQFAHALQRVLENLKDPMTDPNEARKITLDFVFKPHVATGGARHEASVEVKAKVKLASTRKATSQIHMVKRGDNPVEAYTQNVRQEVLELEEEVDPTTGELTPAPKQVTGGDA